MVIKLSEQNIDNAIRLIRVGLRDDIVDANGEIVFQLASLGKEVAIAVNSSAYQTGVEPSVIKYDVNRFKGKGTVYMHGRNAVFDEFGTGEVGADSPHPSSGKINFTMPPYSGYITGPVVSRLVNENGRHYWNVPAGNRPSNSYVDQDTGYTEGVPAGKQIYTASVEVRKQSKKIASRVLNDAIKKYNKE